TGILEKPPELLEVLDETQLRDAEKIIATMKNSPAGLTDEELVIHSNINHLNLLKIIDFLNFNKIIQADRNAFDVLIYKLAPKWETSWKRIRKKFKEYSEEIDEFSEILARGKDAIKKIEEKAKTSSIDIMISTLPKPAPVETKEETPSLPSLKEKMPVKPKKDVKTVPITSPKPAPEPKQEVPPVPSVTKKIEPELPSKKPIKPYEIKITLPEKEIEVVKEEPRPTPKQERNWEKLEQELKTQNLTLDDVLKMKDMIEMIWFALTIDEKKEIKERPYYRDIIEKIGLN
ncbi:MAG: hypothetical protein ACTSRW_13885, partial [Candidatus Helarchaeota archaeon]